MYDCYNLFQFKKNSDDKISVQVLIRNPRRKRNLIKLTPHIPYYIDFQPKPEQLKSFDEYLTLLTPDQIKSYLDKHQPNADELNILVKPNLTFAFLRKYCIRKTDTMARHHGWIIYGKSNVSDLKALPKATLGMRTITEHQQVM